jgi:hypothetical protein
MNRGSVLSMGLLALTLMVSACSQSSNPTATSIGATSETGGDPGILAKLHDPQVGIQASAQGNLPRLVFSAGASGTSDSESMIAARTIESVTFEIHEANGGIVDSETTQNVMRTGVLGPDHEASVTVFAEGYWDSVAPLERGAYLIGIVRGRNGEMLVTRTEIPELSGS